MRGLLTSLLFSLPTASLAAEPVVLPEFSFDSSANFALSVMLQSQLSDRLTEHGHIVLTHEMLVREVGIEAVDRCVEVPGCPSAILPRLPSQIAVVARVAREDGDLIGHVEIWEQSRSSAMEVRDFIITPGSEGRFVDEVANATTALVDQLPPSPPAVLMAAARMVAGQPAGSGAALTQPAPVPVAPVPAPQPGGRIVPPPPPVFPQPIVPYPQPTVPQPVVPHPAYPQPVVPQPVARQPTGSAPVAAVPPRPLKPGDPNRVDYSVVPVRDAIAGTPVKSRHLLGAEKNLVKSGLDPRTWLRKRTPHAGRLIVEPRGGIGIGDVARGADVRIAVIDGVQQTDLDWFQEGPLNSQGARGELYVGFAPVTFFDIGVIAGLQYGGRRFTSGFYGESRGDGQLNIGGDIVSATQFVLQPKLRFYVVPFGPVKPYVFAAGDFRFFDKWNVGEAGGAVFPTPPGGTVPGVVGGGGFLFDPSPIVGFFVEGGYIRHFGTRAGAAQPHGRWNYDDPVSPEGTFGTIPLVAGVQFRL